MNPKTRVIIRESWSVSWPMMFIMFFEFLIGLSDIYIAGRFGKDIQAAYGLSFQLYFVFLIAAFAISVGTVSVISRLFTQYRDDGFGTAVSSSFLMSAAAGLLLGSVCFIFSGNIISNFKISEGLKIPAISLLKIYSLGFLFDYLLINTNAILRASNMIKRSLFTMTMVCVLNIALNFILAFRTPLRFKGLAVATFISLFFGAVLNTFYVRRIAGTLIRFSFSIMKSVLRISWPSGVLQIVWQVGAIALFLILGSLPQDSVAVMAAFTSGLKIESAIFLPAIALNMSNAVVVGNLLGKKDIEGAFNAGIITAFMGIIIITVMTIIIMFNAAHIASFLSSNQIVIKECIRYIYIALLAEPFMAWAVIIGGGLNGAGDTRAVMIIISLSIWLVRLPLSYLLGVRMGLGAVSIWWAMNISIVVHAVFISRRYFSKKWVYLAEKL